MFNIQFLEHLQEGKWNVPCAVQGPGLVTEKLVAAVGRMTGWLLQKQLALEQREPV